MSGVKACQKQKWDGGGGLGGKVVRGGKKKEETISLFAGESICNIGDIKKKKKRPLLDRLR